MPRKLFSKNKERFKKAKNIFLQNNGILRTSQALKLGIPSGTLYAMRDTGLIVQENRGIYRLEDQPPPGNPDLVQVALLVPKAVICLISALDFHNLTTQIPHRIYITLPMEVKRPRFEYPTLDVIWRTEAPYSAGIEQHVLDGVPIHIYNREKTIADCLRYENKVGRDVLLEALKEYRRQKQVNVTALMQYARVNKVTQRMRAYLEILL
jgi:predicted transcriptional regulator of viral defense system